MFDDSNSEDSSVYQNEERPAENPISLKGDITYSDDFPFYDLFDDDLFQREAELAGPSSLDSWKEDRDQQLRRSNETSQPIYDTEGESCDSIIGDEDSLNLHSALPQVISETGNQQFSFSEDEELSKGEILE